MPKLIKHAYHWSDPMMEGRRRRLYDSYRIKHPGAFNIYRFNDWAFPSNQQDQRNAEDKQRNAKKALDAKGRAIQDAGEQPTFLQFGSVEEVCNSPQECESAMRES